MRKKGKETNKGKMKGEGSRKETFLCFDGLKQY